MTLRSARRGLVVCLFCLFLTASMAAPTLFVTPASIANDANGTVQVDVGNVVGSQVVLRLFVDADGDGLIEPGDYAVWTDTIEDDLEEWSPNMPSDNDPAVGTLSVDLRLFGPLGFPYTVGDFVWHVEDTFDGSIQTAAFSVTQASLPQYVSGTVTDAFSSAVVPGALVVLEPFCDAGEEALRLFSAFTDETGAYRIELPAQLNCHHRLVLVAKPGFVGDFLGQPHLVFGGASSFPNTDMSLTPGDRTVTGRAVYATGPRAGLGVPGLPIWAEGDGEDQFLSLAFADENGDYEFTLTDGPWLIAAPEDGLPGRGLVELETEIVFDVDGAPVGLADLALPAANAFFQGTLFDDANAPQGGRWVAAHRAWPCEPDCYYNETLTLPDGSFTLGVVAPPAPGTYEYLLEAVDPLPGLLAENRGCETISEDQTLTGRDLEHVTPTGFITGTMADLDLQGLEGVCLDAWSTTPSCNGYRSIAISGCDGSYSLPVVDDSWNLRVDLEDSGLYRGLDETIVERSVVVSGNEDGVDFVIGRGRHNPTVSFVEPPGAQAGSHVIIDGRGFSLGGTPQVFFDGVPATVLAFRPDLGAIVAEVPSGLSPGDRPITVFNPDLGQTSDPACFEVTPGPFVPACTIDGHATDDTATDLAGAMVIAIEVDSDRIARADVTDALGNYTLDIDTPGIYYVDLIPPAGQPWVRGFYEVTCGATQDHGFVPGWQLTGHLVSDDGEDIADAIVEVQEIGGSEYESSAVSDADGNFSLYVPAGTFDVAIDSPSGSRFTAPGGIQPAVSGDTDLGDITMNRGVLFSGRIVDRDGNPLLAEVEAYRKDNDSWSGFADTNACTGRFAVALPEGEYRLDIWSDDLSGAEPTQVKWIDVAGDEIGEFDFVVADTAALPAGTDARIQFVDPGTYVQAGQPLQIFAVNLDGLTVEAWFSDGLGGFLPGDATLWDAARGLVVTRVPAGAAGGELKLSVDGLDSPGLPLTVLPGTFPAGSFSISGTVDDLGVPVEGAFVGVYWTDPATADCDDDDGLLVDYAATDLNGDYGPLSHPGGDFHMKFLAPATTTLASAFEERFGVTSNLTIDASLVAGLAVHLRAIDDDPGANPIAGVHFALESDGPEDWRLTDANGDATVYVTAGDYDFLLIPPPGSRFPEQEWFESVIAPIDYGDRVMTPGVFLGAAVIRELDGTAVGGALAEAERNTDPFEFFFESFTAADGTFRGPVPAGSLLQVFVEGPDDGLADFQAFGLQMGTADCIFYPPIELGAAGFVEGVIRDASTTAPLAAISLNTQEDNAGTPGDGSGWTESCPDGSYRLKLAAGSHFLHFNGFPPNSYAPEWHPDAVCFDDAVAVTITAGNTTVIDAELDPSGTVSGVVTLNGSPIENVGMCASSSSLGGCYFCGANTDAAGGYVLTVPPAADFQVQASSPGLGSQCYSGFDDCPAFHAVPVVPGADTPGIDFEFGCSGGTELFFDALEAGAPGWAPSGLWHLENEPVCSPTSRSGNTSFYYGTPGCSYDTGGANDGLLLSPIVPGVPAGATLTYWQRRETDGNCFAADRSRVVLSVNGGTPVELQEECDTSGEWQVRAFDLTGHYTPGDDLQIGFDFDTLDPFSNQFLGWMIDDVRLYACPVDCPGDPDNDIDDDGICGDVDNCPVIPNGDQTDADADGLGDVCDACPNDFDNDADADGVCGDVDNCPAAANADQIDADADGAGDVCDACPNDAADDADADGVCGDVDNCPAAANADQIDADADGAGDVCDACPNDAADDADADGVCGDVDNCPAAANADQIDADADGAGDVCDACPDDAADDADADGICGDVDNCPAAANADQADADADGAGDVCDACPNDAADDADADGVCGDTDNCPAAANADQADADSDGAGDVCDACPNDAADDADSDGVCGDTDNCPAAANADQADADSDGAGDVCDACPNDAADDADSDGICGDVDNCPTAANADQADADADGAGDVCDACPNDAADDADSDGVCGDTDNCPAAANADQADADADGAGDVCDACPNDAADDADSDGVCGDTDNCPAAANADQADADADGTGDVCDACPNDAADDADSDGVCGDTDNCPAAANADQADADADGAGDVCDACPNDSANDSDADAVCGDVDNCPAAANADQADADADGTGDVCDACPNDAADDADADGVCGDTDNCPAAANADQADADADGVGDVCDACPNDFANDSDADAVCGDVDNCPAAANADQADTDADGTGDVCDACPNDSANDSDADAVCGDVDNCPAAANADQTDTDADGTGDVCDPDDDDDGVADGADNCPLLANPAQVDRDADGLGNVCDPLRIDFAPADSTVPAGYLHADGLTFDAARGYGWNGGVTTRERSSGTAPLSTLATTDAVRLWSIELANGVYSVQVTVGDPSFAQGTQRVLANGVTLLEDVTTAAGVFHEATETVQVTNGVLVLEVGGGSGNTAINVAEVTLTDQATPGAAINFQPAAAGVPDGYSPDSGLVYDAGRTYGWTTPLQSRERDRDVPQVFDTFVFSVAAATWEMDLAPGVYEVRVAVGDSRWAQGPQRVVVEGTTAVNAVSTSAGVPHEAGVVVDVSDGKLTVEIGGGGGMTAIDQIVVAPAAADVDQDGAANDTDNCPVSSNPAQTDTDEDGRGDACDACPLDAADDADLDGFCGDVDNCPVAANADQADTDADGTGDVCDACPNDSANDSDADAVCGDVDNCPAAANADQTDTDADGTGDVCDPDDDDDGVADGADNCPLLANPAQVDRDADGLGNVCDPLRIDFAPAASTVPAGYLHADGLTFDAARGFGWNGGVTTRERSSGTAPLSTLATTDAVRLWSIELANGVYSVQVTVGDPSFAQGTQRVLANGVTLLEDVTTAAGVFHEATETVQVTNGVLVLEVGGGSGNTAINVAEVTLTDQATPGAAINFQPAAAGVPDGYSPDSGLVYDAGRTYGWTTPLQSRERDRDVPQVFDTFVFSVAAATWEMDLAPGVYEVRVAVGDSRWAQGPQRVVVEGTTAVNAVSTSAGVPHEAGVVVDVSDGKLTVEIGGGGGMTAIDQIVVAPAAADVDQDGAANDTDNCPVSSNPAQTDTDEDGRGDACDACPLDAADDADLDGFCGDVDNCPAAANADQADTDADGTGDVCDACPNDSANDSDADAVCGDVDNCPAAANADQTDTDADGTGDVCDPDDDDDGVADGADNCPLLANPAQVDRDADGLGNVCDPLRIDFAPADSTVPAGYLHADGLSFDAARGYGWNGGVTTRERSSGTAPLSTLATTDAVRLWSIELANGVYSVQVTVGDPSFAQGTQRVLANGVTLLEDVTTAAGVFHEATETVQVTNGVLVLEVGGGSGNTAINVAEVTLTDQATPGAAINFQPAAAGVPDGYSPDSGLVYDAGRTYGWTTPLQSRERDRDVPQVFDTFVFSVAAATWEMDLAPGVYEVRVAVGDSRWAQGPQRVVVEGTTAVNAVSTPAGVPHEAGVVVDVSDGKLTVEIGGGGGNTMLDQIVVTPVAASCMELHQSQPGLASGTHTVDTDGVGGDPAFGVYCDMETDGGGWTLWDSSAVDLLPANAAMPRCGASLPDNCYAGTHAGRGVRAGLYFVASDTSARQLGAGLSWTDVSGVPEGRIECSSVTYCAGGNDKCLFSFLIDDVGCCTDPTQVNWCVN